MTRCGDRYSNFLHAAFFFAKLQMGAHRVLAVMIIAVRDRSSIFAISFGARKIL